MTDPVAFDIKFSLRNLCPVILGRPVMAKPWETIKDRIRNTKHSQNDALAQTQGKNCGPAHIRQRHLRIQTRCVTGGLGLFANNDFSAFFAAK